MDIRQLCLFCLSFLSALGVYAQAEQKDSTVQDNKGVLITLTDGIATTVRHTGRKIRKVGKEFNAVDTTYISPNLYNLAFMLESSSWYEYYRLGSKGNNGEQSLGFSPNASFKLGVYFGWRWIFLGYSFDVKDIFGGHKNKAKKTEMALNLYSSKFGVDLYYRKTGSDFKIRSSSGFDLNTPIKNLNFNGLQSKIKGLNAYWIFNYKKFSYPAAYSQSTNQRRNAGTLTAGLSVSTHNLKFDYAKLPEIIQETMNPGMKVRHIKYTNISLNFGYAYNWVFARNCLACLSLSPAVAYKTSRIEKDTEEPSDWYKNFNIDFILRAGVVYNNSKYFVGTSFLGRTYDYYRDNFSLNNGFGTLQIYAGFNFYLKKEHRKKK